MLTRGAKRKLEEAFAEERKTKVEFHTQKYEMEKYLMKLKTWIDEMNTNVHRDMEGFFRNWNILRIERNELMEQLSAYRRNERMAVRKYVRELIEREMNWNAKAFLNLTDLVSYYKARGWKEIDIMEKKLSMAATKVDLDDVNSYFQKRVPELQLRMEAGRVFIFSKITVTLETIFYTKSSIRAAFWPFYFV
ncbi:unnamed protein product [Orchesella dallaii]|uniref:Uncharacterized protein n=1 Tax=Orchesella dallaii TaxID=48710 RepID=A0ABP1PXJ0_9HEXA